MCCIGAGNDFGSAKELKAEMKAVYMERDRLDALTKRLHSLSSGSSQELARMKEQRQQLRQELEQKEAHHGESLRPVYVRITGAVFIPEEKLDSCGDVKGKEHVEKIHTTLISACSI